MPEISSLFVTRLYKADLNEFGDNLNFYELKESCLSIANDDVAGHDWCEKNAFPGYTSYASLNDLPWRFTIFQNLIDAIDEHVKVFSEDLAFEIDVEQIKLESIWINILPPGGVHTAHIHPRSVISGTVYVATPNGSSAIKFEDPRLSMMMAAPSRKEQASDEKKSFLYVYPKVGNLLLWESWLRHEVPINMSDENRISISFNYSLR